MTATAEITVAPSPIFRPPLRVTATTPEDLQAVSRLRYKIPIEEMGWGGAGEDHARKETADGLDGRATILCLTNGQELAGMVRIISARDAEGSWLENRSTDFRMTRG